MLFVLMFEWLTLFATRRCLVQTLQCAAISVPSGRRVRLTPRDGIRKPHGPHGSLGAPRFAGGWYDHSGKHGRLPAGSEVACPSSTRVDPGQPHGRVART